MNYKAVSREELARLLKADVSREATVFRGHQEISVYVGDDATYVAVEDFPELGRVAQ